MAKMMLDKNFAEGRQLLCKPNRRREVSALKTRAHRAARRAARQAIRIGKEPDHGYAATGWDVC